MSKDEALLEPPREHTLCIPSHNGNDLSSTIVASNVGSSKAIDCSLA